jgi:DNA polymerase V
MIGLVDVNNMYVSCERSFNPALDGKAVVVLSNNDGCIIARSNEAKALGIKMGLPYFQLAELQQEHDIRVFSSNYTLYGDMSARIIATLGRFVERVEVYSIDEAFMDLAGYESIYPDLSEFAHTIRNTIKQWHRIPVSIGLAPTKTLCKVANWYAKREASHGGVLHLATPDQIDSVLADFSVDDLWGVGRRYAGLLKRNDVRTAAQFRDMPDDWISTNLTVNGLRLAYELRGMPCRMLETEPAIRKALCAAPSFGRLIPDKATLAQGLTTHLTRTAEKLRKQDSLAGTITVFLHTNRFKRSPNGELAKQYYNSQTIELPHPTSSTQELLKYALAALDTVFAFGYDYQKVGVILSGFTPADHRQTGLFTPGPDERLIKLSGVMDKLNTKHGRDRVRLAQQQYAPDWTMRQQWVSKRYTTNWKDLIVAR